MNGYWAAIFAGGVAVLSAIFTGVQAFRKQQHEQRTTDTNTAVAVLQGTIKDHKALLESEQKDRKEQEARQDKEIKELNAGLIKCKEDHASLGLKNAGLEAQIRLLEQSVRAVVPSPAAAPAVVVSPAVVSVAPDSKNK